MSIKQVAAVFSKPKCVVKRSSMGQLGLKDKLRYKPISIMVVTQLQELTVTLRKKLHVREIIKIL